MKTEVKITDINKEDLVNLLSSALYGSSYLSADYEESVEHNEDDCYEDIMANILLHGGKIMVTDGYAEDGEVYGSLSCRVDEDKDEGRLTTTYFVTLKDILSGLERAANGTFNMGEYANHFGSLSLSPEWQDKNKAFAWRSFNAFAFDDAEWDLTTADCLMQIILFNEIVYG